MQAKSISVVISNFNGAKYLPRILESLNSQVGVTLEIIVVDRHSTDESHAILRDHPEVVVIHESPESGLVTGYAVGAEKASHDLLFFCNEDMWFDTECLLNLANAIDLEQRVAAADPWQWSYDGAVWIHGGTRFFPGNYRSRTPYPFRRNEFTVPLEHGERVPFGCAGAVMIHRRIYEEVGGWDRSFFLDLEDIDLFIRTWQQGWECVSVPEAKVFHAVNVSNEKSLSGGKLLVGKRRYISGRSSGLIIATKYFGPAALFWSLLFWLEVFFRHALLLRGTQTRWNVLAAHEFFKRLPAALAYRSLHKHDRAKSPGEAFFTNPDFQGRLL